MLACYFPCVRHKDIGQDAARLGVHPSHLWRVLRGDHPGSKLGAAYARLQAAKKRVEARLRGFKPLKQRKLTVPQPVPD